MTQKNPSASFEVTNFCTNGKLVCDYLCVNVSRLRSCTVSEIWRISRSNFCCRQGLPLKHSFVVVSL